MGIPVVDGRNFLVSDVGNAIMNQRLKDLGGKIEITEGMGSIIGQTSDVRINSLRNETAPICYIYVPKDFATLGYVYIRLQNGYDKTGVTEKINAILTEMDPSYLFEVEYYEEVMERAYESEIRQGKPAAWASTMETGSPSNREGIRNTSIAWSRRSTSVRTPVKMIRSRMPSAAACCSTLGRRTPSPTSRSRVSAGIFSKISTRKL